MTATLLSMNAFGSFVGVSRRAVQKAAARGRITVRPDGLIDAEQAVREWGDNTHQAMQRDTRRDDDRILTAWEIFYLDSLTPEEWERLESDEPLTPAEAAQYRAKWVAAHRRPARRRARA